MKQLGTPPWKGCESISGLTPPPFLLGFPNSLLVPRKRGRPRNTWHRDIKAEMQRSSHYWKDLEKAGQSKAEWSKVACPRKQHNIQCRDQASNH